MTSLIAALTQTKSLNPVGPRGGGGWMSVVREPSAGAWQRNMEQSRETVLSQATVFACITLIAGDVSKLPWGLRQRNGKIWEPATNPAYDPVLRRPNAYQNSQQFRESWLLSKLIHGNAYILKGRDGRGVVNRMWVLNPQCVQPLVTEMGDVYYRLNKDPLSDQYQDEATVPASEVIHDRFNCLFHPLIGIAPLYAAARLAGHSLTVQDSSDKFFANGARPGGILVAPGAISAENAKALKDQWESSYSGPNSGKVAVLGDGLVYTPMTMKSTDAQLIEQLRWDDEQIAKVYHVPKYKVGIGDAPPYGNFQSVNLDYYNTCLQPLMEAIEWCLQDGLELPENTEVHIDTDDLLRMDSLTQMDLTVKGVSGGVLSPNEGREYFNRNPVDGGHTPYLQQQNFSLAALHLRDTKEEQQSKDVQGEALNGAQVTSLQGIVLAAASGLLPKQSAEAIISAAFPLMTPEQVAEIIDPISEGSISLDAAAKPQTAPVSAPASDSSEEKALLELFRKSIEYKP